MIIFKKGVTYLHIALFILFTMLWAAFADAHKMPGIMLSYFFPYQFSARGMGINILGIILFQLFVLATYISAIKSSEKQRIAMNIVATIVAILWFLFSTLSVFTAHLH